MHNTIERLMSNSSVSGLSVAIIRNDKIHVICRGVDDQTAINENTVWNVASLTKPIFVYGVLQLVQQGLLELDRPLHAYLAQPYIESVDDLSPITARHTMSHTSGLPNWRDSNELRLLYPTGERFSYSSEGLNYLQYVAEQLLSTTFADYLRENVFIPFGMVQTELAQKQWTRFLHPFRLYSIPCQEMAH